MCKYKRTYFWYLFTMFTLTVLRCILRPKQKGRHYAPQAEVPSKISLEYKKHRLYVFNSGWPRGAFASMLLCVAIAGFAL